MPTYKENALAEDVSNMPRPKCYMSMSKLDYLNGCGQMLADLKQLASEDGCVAAAWAHSLIEQAAPMAELMHAVRTTIKENGEFYDDNTHSLEELRELADNCFAVKVD